MPLRPTEENLTAHALRPAMRWLIAVALDGSTMTYGQLKMKLETEADFSPIFPVEIGFVAGSLMERILEADPDAPLINILVVGQGDGQPSEGAGSYLAKRFGDPRLAEKNAKKRHPRLWKRAFERAAAGTYKYGGGEWAKLYKEVFGSPLSVQQIETAREERQRGTERDGIPTGRDYGSGGEGKFHKALRLWVRDNPQAVHRTFSNAAAETEVNLDSGDRVDVAYKCSDRVVVIEVKSRVSNEADFRRGVFQCVKYRAVRKAMDVRRDAIVEAYLVTEGDLPGGIAALARRHKIRHFRAPQDRT